MLEVTQADRELFIAILNPCESVAESVRKGMSYTWEVEQIARHRLAEREAVVKWLRGLHWTHLDAEPAKRIANAIEAGEPFK